ncbi:MAG: tRNA sulfurtransferase [Porticoccaceae bacterium]|nr:MAG: tRNA sulfurtransferase [Porticoccaceae bacterium]
MHYIVRLCPEITIKSTPVRRRLTRQLRHNLRRLLRAVDPAVTLTGDWEKLDVWLPEERAELAPAVEEVLASTPGIAKFSRVRSFPLAGIEEIARRTAEIWGPRLAGRTFAVRVKRSGEHPFRSVDVERQVGAALLALGGARGVDLSHPEVEVRIEVLRDAFHLVDAQQPGLGGFPLGSQGGVLSLVSGGFDSTVASYLCMRRGLLTHFCFFNLGGRAHERGVKEVSYYLWRRFAASHRVRFVTVPFEEVVAEILARVEDAYMGVVLKRLMLRAAARVARELELPALVTGESVAQVSSQTLANLSAIDEAAGMLTLRPLVAMDKGEIIALARRIGTEPFSAAMPEYCGVISVKPTTRARRERLLAAEAAVAPEVLERALAARREERIDALSAPAEGEAVEICAVPRPGDTVVDIRHPDEARRSPLAAGSAPVLAIPFFELERRLAELDPASPYLLYCDRGVMSRLQAEALRERGFRRVGVYRPAGS